jgi:flagellar L-ring protein precursor FlgH
MKFGREHSRALASLALAATLVALSGCNALDRVSKIGEQPELSAIDNPQTKPGYRPISLPMPPPQVSERQPNSLWRAGSRGFFKDLRATRVGDLVTVVINFNESGTLQDSTTRTRANTETNNVTSLLGFQNTINRLAKLSGSSAGQTPNVLDLASNLSNGGTGQIQRQETVNLRLAALVEQMLPNGNMVLYGHQEVRLNFEVRELQLGGVIRPEDIAPDNTINYDQIAEARISYGGRGQITDVQQPRYGSQLLDVIMPF